jgi:uncharacterized protein YceK
MKALLLIFTTLILNGCASMGSYTVSETELEDHFKSAVEQFDHEQLKAGSPLSIQLNDIDIKVGPDNRDVIQLAIEGEIAFDAVLMKFPVDISVNVEGAPVYISKDNAIYIRRLKLLDSNVEAMFLTGKNEILTDNFMNILSKLLETIPVYQLDEADFTQRLIATIPTDIKVGKGKLIFVPSE